MQDQNDGKIYALKCFTRDQEGRNESYRLIADELQYVDSEYLTKIQYLENELFVDTGTDDTEFPVLLMDWVEGETLDKSKGTYLSGGEQQRIAIARVMLRNTPILILDEATAFADPENEEKVLKAFDEISKDKTVIKIAHRLSTVVDCNQIFVLNEGKIIENGTHQQLISQNGMYSKMFGDYQKSVEWKIEN